MKLVSICVYFKLPTTMRNVALDFISLGPQDWIFSKVHGALSSSELRRAEEGLRWRKIDDFPYKDSRLVNTPLQPLFPPFGHYFSGSDRREQTVRSVLNGPSVLFYHYHFWLGPCGKGWTQLNLFFGLVNMRQRGFNLSGVDHRWLIACCFRK